MASFTRQEIAGAQLERALQLYLDERDHIAAITLASAAEAILEGLLEEAGPSRPPATARDGAIQFSRRWRHYFRHRPLIRIAEAVRTGLRHVPEDDAAFEPDDVARDVLARAIAKQMELTGRLTPRMRRFGTLLLDEARRPATTR